MRSVTAAIVFETFIGARRSAGRKSCLNTVMPPFIQKLLSPDKPFRVFRVFRGSLSTQPCHASCFSLSKLINWDMSKKQEQPFPRLLLLFQHPILLFISVSQRRRFAFPNPHCGFPSPHGARIEPGNARNHWPTKGAGGTPTAAAYRSSLFRYPQSSS